MDESTPAPTNPPDDENTVEIADEIADENAVDIADAAEPVIAATVEATADAAPAADRLDLDGIERDLADVEVALARLDAGRYWTDEVTGQPLPAELLQQHPTARRI